MKVPVDLPEGAVAYLIKVATKPRSLAHYYRALAALEAMGETDLKRLLKRYKKTPEKVDTRALGWMIRRAKKKAPDYAGRVIVDPSVLDQLSGRRGSAGVSRGRDRIALIHLHREGPGRPEVVTMTAAVTSEPTTPPRPDDMTPEEWATLDDLEARMIPRARLLELAAARRPPEGLYDDEDSREAAR